MSDLTREEIRQACEAVGWRWSGVSARDGEVVRFSSVRNINAENADAVALLESWRSQHPAFWWIVESADDGFRAILMQGSVGLEIRRDATLPAAAVRAVNAWAESRGGKTP